jgi:hypothetical protein
VRYSAPVFRGDIFGAEDGPVDAKRLRSDVAAASKSIWDGHEAVLSQLVGSDAASVRARTTELGTIPPPTETHTVQPSAPVSVPPPPTVSMPPSAVYSQQPVMPVMPVMPVPPLYLPPPPVPQPQVSAYMPPLPPPPMAYAPMPPPIYAPVQYPPPVPVHLLSSVAPPAPVPFGTPFLMPAAPIAPLAPRISGEFSLMSLAFALV